MLFRKAVVPLYFGGIAVSGAVVAGGGVVAGGAGVAVAAGEFGLPVSGLPVFGLLELGLLEFGLLEFGTVESPVFGDAGLYGLSTGDEPFGLEGLADVSGVELAGVPGVVFEGVPGVLFGAVDGVAVPGTVDGVDCPDVPVVGAGADDGALCATATPANIAAAIIVASRIELSDDLFMCASPGKVSPQTIA